uniref:Putative secreted protein n=1 Tax=Anopheles darlingi TaxID=43151 RepID=A0A2M4D836_ANODA
MRFEVPGHAELLAAVLAAVLPDWCITTADHCWSRTRTGKTAYSYASAAAAAPTATSDTGTTGGSRTGAQHFRSLAVLEVLHLLY